MFDFNLTLFCCYGMMEKLRQKKQRGEKVKADRRVIYISLGVALLTIISLFTFQSIKLSGGEKKVVKKQNYTTEKSIPKENTDIVLKNIEQEKQAENNLVYDGMTLEQLTDKLNRSLTSTLSGKGDIFARRSIELGIDPYLSIAIVLHETGCTWNCSNLVKQCNNVGGMKGYPTCGNSSYKYFPTLEDGINGYIDNLYNNYVAQGLTTPELINPKYAASQTWATQVNRYIDKIKAS